MYKNIKTELEKLAAEDPTMANRVAAIILEKMATDANGEATPMGVAIGGAVDETAFAGDMAAKEEQERRGEPDELLENMEAISAPEEFTAEGVADMEVPATDVAEAFLSQRTASEVVNDLYKLASEEPDLAEKLASAILELGQIDIPEKTATEFMVNLYKVAQVDAAGVEKLATEFFEEAVAEKIASEFLEKAAGKWDGDVDYRDADHNTRFMADRVGPAHINGLQVAGQELKGAGIGAAGGAAVGAGVGAIAGRPGQGAAIGAGIGAYGGAGIGGIHGLLTKYPERLKEMAIANGIELTEDEINKNHLINALLSGVISTPEAVVKSKLRDQDLAMEAQVR